jgi:hypothetical protein
MTINSGTNGGSNGRAKTPLFAKVIAVGYEDGPTAGAVQSIDGTTAYRFKLLATDIDGVYDLDAWDRGEELHVFSLTMLPSGSFERIVAALSQIEEPTWPVWVPGMRHPSHAIDELMAREVEPLLDEAVGESYVVATASLIGPPSAVDHLVDLEQPQDWFARLGLGPASVAS